MNSNLPAPITFAAQTPRRKAADSSISEMMPLPSAPAAKNGLVPLHPNVANGALVVEIEKIVYVEKDARPSKPLYKGGQAVHQFWAAWMNGAEVSPTGIKGKARPAWFNSQVFAATALSPSMPRCRNDRDFPRHQLSRSLSFRHLGMLGDRNVPRCCIQRFGRQSATADSRRQSGATESTDGTAKLTKGWPLSGQ